MTSRAFPTPDSPAPHSLTPWAPLEGGEAARRAGGQGWALFLNGAWEVREQRPLVLPLWAVRGGTPLRLRDHITPRRRGRVLSENPLPHSSLSLLDLATLGLCMWQHQNGGRKMSLSACLFPGSPPAQV